MARTPIEEEPPKAPPELGLSDVLAVSEDPPTELDKVLELLLDPKNIAHNTELSKSEITAFSVLNTMRSRHNLPVLTEFLSDNMTLRVSKGRAGRKEWVKIVARHLDPNADQPRGGFLDRMFRRPGPPR